MDWISAPTPVDYLTAVQVMEGRVAALAAGTAAPLVWVLEHPALYTAGTSANAADLRDPRFPVYQTGRGGQYTYHGPGQLVAYVMLRLSDHYVTPDLRRFVADLEEWVILTLAQLGVVGERRDGRIGVWVRLPGGGEGKIAALGIRIRRGISYHGISLNIAPDLGHYAGIVPCGIQDYGVTSLADLGISVTFQQVEKILKESFAKIFKI